MSEDGRARKETVAQIFDRAASVYDQSGIFAYFGERLATLAQVAHGARVLDVATGRGAVLFPAAIRIGTQGHVCGIDLSARMVQETGLEIKRRRLQNAKVVKMDAEALDFPYSLIQRFCRKRKHSLKALINSIGLLIHLDFFKYIRLEFFERIGRHFLQWLATSARPERRPPRGWVCVNKFFFFYLNLDIHKTGIGQCRAQRIGLVKNKWR